MRFAVALCALVIAGLAPRCATPGARPTPGDFQVMWEYPEPSAQPLSTAVDGLGRPYLYVAEKEGGVAVLDISSQGVRPTRAGGVERASLEGLDAMDVVARGSHLFVALGNFFSNEPSPAGLAVLDVDDPRSPSVVSLWSFERPVGGSASVLVDGDYAYLGAMGEGVFILDVSDVRNTRLIATIQPDVDFPTPNPNRIQHPNARGMASHDDMLFVAYDAGGLRVVDVSDKQRPREIGRYINTRMLGKQQAYNNVVLEWPTAYVALDYCGLEVLDVRDPTAIRQVGWWNPWRCDAPTNLWFNSPGHTNQLALDPVRDLVFLSAGDSELEVADVSNPTRPERSARFGGAKDGRGAWGVTLGDDLVYVTYIRAPIPFRGTWSGVRAFSRPQR